MTAQPDVMNAIEAAAFLGVHVETLRKLARRNELPSFKMGRDWRFRREALVKWADHQRPAATSATETSWVLVIDDEARVCRAMVHALGRLGYTARHTTSAKEGLSLVAEKPPALGLLDL